MKEKFVYLGIITKTQKKESVDILQLGKVELFK